MSLVAGINGGSTRKMEVYNVIVRLLSRSQKGAWYRILPKDGVYNDITAATACSWDILLPLLVEAGLLRFIVTSDIKETHVRFSQWEELSKASVLSGEVKMEISSIRRKGKPKEYFYCIGRPELKGPQEQNDCFNKRGSTSFVWSRLHSTRNQEFQKLFHTCESLALQIWQ